MPTVRFSTLKEVLKQPKEPMPLFRLMEALRDARICHGDTGRG